MWYRSIPAEAPVFQRNTGTMNGKHLSTGDCFRPVSVLHIQRMLSYSKVHQRTWADSVFSAVLLHHTIIAADHLWSRKKVTLHKGNSHGVNSADKALCVFRVKCKQVLSVPLSLYAVMSTYDNILPFVLFYNDARCVLTCAPLKYILHGIITLSRSRQMTMIKWWHSLKNL